MGGGTRAARRALRASQPHATIVEDLKPVVGERQAQDVLAQSKSAMFVVGGNFGGSMQVKAKGA